MSAPRGTYVISMFNFNERVRSFPALWSASDACHWIETLSLPTEQALGSSLEQRKYKSLMINRIVWGCKTPNLQSSVLESFIMILQGLKALWNFYETNNRVTVTLQDADWGLVFDCIVTCEYEGVADGLLFQHSLPSNLEHAHREHDYHSLLNRSWRVQKISTCVPSKDWAT